MAKKILALSLAFVMLSVTAFASGKAPVFTKAGGKITAVTEMATVDGTEIISATHTAALPEAWDGKSVSAYTVPAIEGVSGTIASYDVAATGSNADVLEYDEDDKVYIIDSASDLVAFGKLCNTATRITFKDNSSKVSSNYTLYTAGSFFDSTKTKIYVASENEYGDTFENIAGTLDGGYDKDGNEVEGGTYEKATQDTYVLTGTSVKGYAIGNIADYCEQNARLESDIVLSTDSKRTNYPESARLGTNTTSIAVTYYKGKFDGNGHTIYGYAINERTYFPGLFKFVSGATIKNLKMVDVDIKLESGGSTATAKGAVIASYVTGGSVIDNVYLSGKVGFNGKDNSYITLFGSIAANLNASTISNCYSDLEIDFETNRKKTVGYQPAHDVSSSTDSHDTTGIGGIVGVMGTVKSKNYSSGVVSNCGFGGSIYAPGYRRVGGIAGANVAHHTSVKNCWNTGSVTGFGDVGGIIGYTGAYSGSYGAYGHVFDTNAYNTGKIVATATTDTYVAGIGNHGIERGENTAGYVYNVGEVGIKDSEITTNVAQIFTSDNKAQSSSKNIYITDNSLQAVSLKGEESPGNTGVTREQLMSEEIFTTALLDGFVKDSYNLNGGYPVLATQLDTLVTDEKTYEIANYTNVAGKEIDKELLVNVGGTGYVSLDIKPFGAEEVTIKAFAADGTTELDSVTVSEAGIITLATGENTNVLLKAITGRALINLDLDGVQAGDTAVTVLENGIIEATFDTEADSATVVIALYENATTLRTVVYAPATAAANGKISATIDLTETDIAGCTLKAFLWEDETLIPISPGAEL